MRDFDKWLAEFRPSIASFSYYCDFEKCVTNANQYRNELHLLNALIGQPDVEARFREIVREYPKVLMVIPTLLAIRYREIRAQDSTGAYLYDFKRPHPEKLGEYCYLMRETGLFDLIEHRLTNNLYDYALGVEVGLDSNGRKNRGGHLMEDLVESYIADAGLRFTSSPMPSEYGVYAKEMYLRDVERVWGVDLSALSNDGNTSKRFDFVVRTHKSIYGIETNFYASSGSKLNETARSYKMLAVEAAPLAPRFFFIWFTDGAGWSKTKRNLRETFDVLDTMYNVADLERGICKELFV